MNYYLLIPLLAFLTNSFLIVYVFAQRRRDELANAFISYSIVLNLWMIYNFYIWLPLDSDLIFLGMKYGAPSWMSLGFFILRFTYILTKKKKDLIYKLSFLPISIALILTLFTDNVIAGPNLEYWGHSIKGGKYYLPVVFFVVVPPILYSLSILFYRGLLTDSEIIRKQYFMLLAGFGIVLFLSLISTIIFPYFLHIKIPPITSGSAVIQSGITIFAIFRYRFLSLSLENVAEDIFSQVQDGVILLNKNFVIEQINESGKKLLSINNSLGCKIIEILPKCDPINEYKNKEFEIQTDEGNKYISLSHSFLKNSLTESGSLMILRDITDKKEDEAKIKKLYETVMEDLEFARITQKALIPDTFPISDLYKIKSLFTPVEKVGGDVINCRTRSDGSLDIFFADVSGHGVSAAMVASSATIAFNVSSEAGLSPKEGLLNIHNLLSPTITQHYISAVYLNYNPMSGKMIYSYAGHHPILHISKGSITKDIDGTGMLLLAVPYPEFQNYNFELKKDEKILLYSDGLYEVRNPKNQLMGRTNFMRICKLASETSTDFLRSIENYSINYSAGNQSDDMTLLLLERTN